MTSRIPPSRRDPEFAPHRAAKALSALVPGAGRVPGASRVGVSAAVAAAIRGKPSSNSPTNYAAIFNVRDYGAKGDGITDDTAAINAAIAACETVISGAVESGGIVYFPAGTYKISATITAGQSVTFLGAARQTTTIKAAAGFTGKMIRFRLFGSRVERLTVDCNHTATCGIYTNDANEQSGVFQVLIGNIKTDGILIDDVGSTLFPQHFSLDDLELYFSTTSTTATPAGINLVTGLPREISNVTINNGDSATQLVSATGIRLKWGMCLLRSIHPEHLGIGVDCDGATGTILVGVKGGPLVTTAVRIRSGTFAVTVVGASIPFLYGGNTVVDDNRGWSSGDGYVPLYVGGEKWHQVGDAGEPGYLNSWSTFGFGNPGGRFYKDANGIVHLGGLIKAGVYGANAFLLPVGYRPETPLFFPSVSNGAFGWCYLDNSGAVQPVVGAVGNWFSLDGISFRAA